MNFEAVIGLEIHVQMKTKTKMFSSAPNSFSRSPNSEVAPLDMAFPGTLPTVNKQAVINAIRVANALHMEIDRTILFDRKNYFYSDLPKGYQITQQNRPIGKNGYLVIKANGVERKIGIERIHMEEDTCKQVHYPDCSLLDYNRAGVPLVEIVSHPEMHNGTEAMKYVEGIRNIVVYSLTSDGKMEEGSLRCDVNVSIRPIGQKAFGTKVEIKNLNSLKNIESAIDYEINRQSEDILSGKPIRQETRRFDESNQKTTMMRLKTDAVDYKYFPEANITPISLSEDFIADAIATCPELYDTKLNRFIEMGLNETDASIILSDRDVASYFEKAADIAPGKEVANYLSGELSAFMNKNSLNVNTLGLDPVSLGQAINVGAKEKLTHKQIADILLRMCETGEAPEAAQKALGIVAMSTDSNEVDAAVKAVLEANPQSIVDFKAGKDRALGFLVGQVMKASHGKLNPANVSKALLSELKK